MMDTFFWNVKFQIVATIVLFIVAFHYFKNRKLPILSTRYFTTMFVFSVINIIFDFGTVYTLVNMNQVPGWINDLAHRIFIITIDGIIVSLYLYVATLANKQKRFGMKGIFLRLIPFLISTVVVMVGQIQYYHEDDGIYSYGMPAQTVYVSVAIYVIAIFVTSFNRNIRKDKRRSVRFGLLIWIAVALLQMTHPTLLISSVGSIMMVLYIYMDFENPKEHDDDETAAFNKRAYYLMLEEKFGARVSFNVVNVVFDGLETISARFGHETCNEFLMHVSCYLNEVSQIRVFHTERNTFSILCMIGADSEKIIKDISERLRRPWSINKNNIIIHSHVDVAECPAFAKTVEQVFDVTRYMKERRINVLEENNVCRVDKKLLEAKNRYEQVERIVENAIEKDGFEVYFQPIYSTEKGRFLSCEALVRLQDNKTVGFVSPEEFIPIAEKKGMILSLGDIVFRKVCEFVRDRKPQQYGVRFIEVNLSGIQIVDEGLCVRFSKVMEQYHVSPDMFNFEITETAAVEAEYELKSNMNKIKTMGSSFSMDDFGTGYSNLSLMAEVPYDLVKLDKSLIWPCFEDAPEKPGIILDDIVNMLKRLHKKVVAEGVETVEMLAYLQDRGVDYMQGYYFSKPLNAESYIDFLKKKAQSQILWDNGFLT